MPYRQIMSLHVPLHALNAQELFLHSIRLNYKIEWENSQQMMQSADKPHSGP